MKVNEVHVFLHAGHLQYIQFVEKVVDYSTKW